MQVPQHFWVDAVSTACFFINRMPSSVLNWDTPYHILFPNKPLFPIEPRVFGCACFVRDVRRYVSKLDPKSLKCAYPISSFYSYDRLSSQSCSFIASLNSILLPNKVSEALTHPGWRSAMIEGIDALIDNSTMGLGTWFVYPLGRKPLVVIGCLQ